MSGSVSPHPQEALQVCVQADRCGECAMHFHRMSDQECSFQIMNRSLGVTPVQLVLTALGLARTVCQRDPRSWLTQGPG